MALTTIKLLGTKNQKAQAFYDMITRIDTSSIKLDEFMIYDKDKEFVINLFKALGHKFEVIEE